MRGEKLGDYLVEEEIGSGGMGTVHRARSDDGDAVAVKVVHAHLLSKPGILERFRREAALGSQVANENVVRTLSVGEAEVDGRPRHYLVMEYVEGRTLRDLLEDLGRVPEALLREIARQIAGGLAAIHAAGIVHRDLKPENVLITRDRMVRIMDLGVARLVEESVALTREGQFAGSICYAAPEQFRRGEVSPAGDLYSLGVVLYELATGENPFLRDEAVHVMAAHIEEQPIAAALRNPEVSPLLSEVIDTLLSKEPGDRFASAGELREVLGRGDRSSWWAAREQALRRAGGRLPSVRVDRETNLYGRDSELDALRGAWARARQGRGGTMLLEGEAGIGKTRLVDRFLSDLGPDDAHILYGSYPPSGGLGALSEAILDHLGASDLESALTPYLEVTPRLVPAFSAMLKHEAPPEGSQPVEGDALHTLFCHLLHGMSADKPVLWVVDDLHFAGPESRRIVLSLARAAQGHRVLVVGTARPGIPEEEIAHLGQVEGFLRITIGRLSPREVVELLQDAFHSEMLADRLGAKIAFKSDGVPFFVFEMIRGLREGRFIERGADGAWVETKVVDRIEVPSAVRDLVAARLADLSEEERSILDVGAVQGFEFRADLIAEVREMRRLVVLEHLATVERRSGVVRSGAEGFRFDHHQVHEVLYGGIPEALRSEYHAEVADAFARLEAPDPRAGLSGEAAVFLTHHHLRGSRPRSCVPALPPALSHLEDTYRNEAALDLMEWSLGHPGLLEGEGRADVLMRKAKRLELLGRSDDERAALLEAGGLADGSDSDALRARVRARLAGNLHRRGRDEEAEATLDEAKALARTAGDRDVEGQVLQQLGNVLWSRDRFEAARASFEEAVAIARETGHPRREALGVGSLGNVSLAQGRNEEAGELYEEALSLAERAGDMRLGGWIAGNLGSVYWNLGRKEDARRCYQRSLSIAREIGDRPIEGSATGNLGRVFGHDGRYAEALEQLERRIAMARETGAARGEAIAKVNLGMLRANLGDLGGAEALLESARERFLQMDAYSMLVYALIGLGDVARKRGLTDVALGHYREARDHREQAGDSAGAASLLTPIGLILLDRGEVEEAASTLRLAIEGTGESAPESAVLAAAGLAGLSGEELAPAVDRFRESRDTLGAETELDALWLLYRASSDRSHLEEAHRLLIRLRDHAPDDCAVSMLSNVPRNREIMAEWERLAGN